MDTLVKNALKSFERGSEYTGWIFSEWLRLNQWTHKEFADLTNFAEFPIRHAVG